MERDCGWITEWLYEYDMCPNGYNSISDERVRSDIGDELVPSNYQRKMRVRRGLGGEEPNVRSENGKER